MSRRQEKRERLARDLDAGKISLEQYEREIARMKTGSRGRQSVIEASIRLQAKLLAGGEITQQEHDRRLAQIAASGTWTTPRDDWSPGK